MRWVILKIAILASLAVPAIPARAQQRPTGYPRSYDQLIAAARGLLENTKLSPAEIVKKSLTIAGDLCIYTNQNHLIETLT